MADERSGPSHQVREGEHEGFGLCELVSPAGLVASYAPGAGMVCCSLRSGGVELLGLRAGLTRYAEVGATMGIPLLHPWANRLARTGYAVDGVEVAVPNDSPLVHDDGQGLPIHGVVGGLDVWQVETATADADRAHLAARLDFAAHPELMALFPFAHELRMEVTLRGATLAVRTTLRATGDRPVPVAFGYHPYFRLPDLPRAAWEVTLPVRRRAQLDHRCLPTGATETIQLEPGPLGDRTFDDLFPGLEPDPVFALAGGGRRIELAFGAGYDVAVVYAPADDDVVCFEPMTAPTNPFGGGHALRRVEPGASFTAEFAVTVHDASAAYPA
ncbi:MAG: aldose 1-epimerase [Myxococcota bacterium]|nr:aldose 1-epimerase [Myxococcota bacterium]